MNQTIKQQDRRIREIGQELEREKKDVDPYINVQTKQQRMVYQQPNVYVPLNNYIRTEPVSNPKTHLLILMLYRMKISKSEVLENTTKSPSK